MCAQSTAIKTYATALSFDAKQACQQLAKTDPVLGQLIKKVGPYRPHTTAAPSVFHALLRAITYQQLSGKAAGAIHQRVLALFNQGNQPTPQAVAAARPEDLRQAGLSRNKIATIQALAQAIASQQLPAETELSGLDDEAIIKAYSAIRGIGRWTVQMLLLFHLGRPDVMPSGDLGIQKGYALTYGLDKKPTPKQLEKLCEPWRPYRSVGSWYMWRSLEKAGAQPQPG